MISIPGYQVVREIGRGGMATVYLARQGLLDREVALKVMAPELARESVHAQRFLQEARMLAALTHPHVVPVYDVGVTPDGLHYFSMQLLPGGDFAARMKSGMLQVELLRVLRAVAGALGFAHARGYVHRDVTPANILFDAEQRPLLTDFGIARALAATSRITAHGLSVGTSRYMSPEQARGLEVDSRSDIYSLGVIMFEALAQRPPYSGEDGFAVAYAHVHEPVPRLPAEQAIWQPVIDRALAKQPADRFPDCAAFIGAIDGVLRQVGVAPVQASRPRSDAPTLPPRKRQPAEVDPASSSGVRPPAAARSRPATASPRPAKSAAPSVANQRSAEIATSRAAASPPVSSSRRPEWLPLVVGSAAVALLLVGILWWFSRPAAPDQAAEHPRLAPAPEAVAEPPPAVPARTQPDLPDPPVADEFAEIGEDIELDDLPTVRDPVADFIAMGNINIAAGRLVEPPVRNALERFQLALRIEPQNTEAAEGILRVAEALLQRAAAADPDTDTPAWLAALSAVDQVAEAHPAAAAAAVEAARLRTIALERRLAAGEAALAGWRRSDARRAFATALAIEPDAPRAVAGARVAEALGQPGYRFRDALESGGRGPEMVVVGDLAISRHELSVAEFRSYWQAAGASRSELPSCRDRESIFRSSRRRSWEAPGIEQTENHPVVCVSYPMAEDYTRWLAESSGQRYRLPTVAEWKAAAAAPPAPCAANLRDASYREALGGRDGADCDDGHAQTAAAGAFRAGALGLHDLWGNVREWVSDCPSDSCRERAALGGSWMSTVPEDAAEGMAPDVGFNTVGIRLVRDLPAIE